MHKFFKSINRTIIVLYYAAFVRNAVYIAFTGCGISIYEKCVQALIFRIFGKKNAVFLRSSEIFDYPMIKVKLMRFFLNLPTKRIFQGHSIKKYIVSERNISNSIVIKNWVTAVFTPKLQPAIDNGIFQFLFIGWLEKEKGVQELLSAFKSILEKNPHVRLTICGNGTLQDEVLQFASEFPTRVDFLGWCSPMQITEILAKIDYIVLPSHTEGMPNVIIEAMSQSVPAICTNVGAIPDLICDGKNGYMFEVNDVEALRLTLKEIVSKPKNNIMREEAFNTILEHHSREKNILKLLDYISD